MTAMPEEEDERWWAILGSTLRRVPSRDARDDAPALDMGAGYCTEVFIDCPRAHWISDGYHWHALRE